MIFFQNNLFRDEMASTKPDLGAFITKKIDFFSHKPFSGQKKLIFFCFNLSISKIGKHFLDSIRVFAKKTGVFLCCITSFGCVYG
jgi:hypothetical protein